MQSKPIPKLIQGNLTDKQYERACLCREEALIDATEYKYIQWCSDIIETRTSAAWWQAHHSHLHLLASNHKAAVSISHLTKQLEIMGLSISCLETSVASLQRRIDQLEEGGLVEEPKPIDLSQVPTFLGGTKTVLKGLEQNPALESIQESVARINLKSSSMSFSEFVEENAKTLDQEES